MKTLIKIHYTHDQNDCLETTTSIFKDELCLVNLYKITQMNNHGNSNLQIHCDDLM